MQDYSGGDPTAAMAGIMGTMGIIWLVILVFFIFLYFKIFSKAGYSGWLALLMIVPIVNIILIIWFAFADWPVVKQARGGALRSTAPTARRFACQRRCIFGNAFSSASVTTSFSDWPRAAAMLA
jgi:hypothetical protein